MLQSIRNRAQGWLAWVIVILITIPFALWGIQEYFGGGREPAAATVNGVEIPQREVQRVAQTQRQRLLAALGANADPALLDELRLHEAAREGLIENELLFQTVEDAGFRVGDEQLVAQIHAIPAFQENGVFSPEKYSQALRNQGMLPGGFEPMLRRDLMIEQLRRGIEESAFVTDMELEELVRLQEQRRDMAYLILPSKKYEAGVEVSEEEIAAYYDQHPQEFTRPEQVSIEYIELDLDQLASDIKVDDATLRDYFEDHKSSYAKPEQRRASHILIPLDADADEEAVAKARAKAEALIEQIKGGASFVELARKESGDPGSAREGGDLGWFGRGVMEPAFEKVAFSLKEGEVSDPVRTEFGFHIIEVTGIKPGGVPEFEAIRERVATDYRREQAEKRYYEAAEQLANLSYEHPDTLQPAAEQLGLEIKSSPLFSRQGGEGITADPKVIAAAFSEEVVEQGYNSEPVELGPEQMVVLRKKEYVPEQLQPLAEVKESIVQRLRVQKAGDAAFAEASKIARRAADGEEMEALAKEYGLEWRRVQKLSRRDREVEPAIVREVFRIPRPEGGKPRFVARRLNGEAAVIALFGVEDGDVSSIEAAKLKQERESLATASGRADYADLVKELKSRAEISRLDEEE